MSRLEYRILGPLEVWRAGERLVLGRRSERALLTLLAASPNQVVSSERLADDLWAGAPPPTASTALRVYVSRLRKALVPDGDALVTRPPGYVLTVESDAVDSARFEALAAQGRERAAAGDHSAAADAFRQGLALWRGRALADVADAPLARAEAGRLEEARLAALEDRLEADIACGRHREITGELEALTQSHPLRERLWALRILALYRDGRQAESLRAYQDLRRLLGEELGLEPSEPLRALESAVLRHDLRLDQHAVLRRAPGEGPSKLRLGLPLPGRLPPRPEMGFVGRDAQLGELTAAFKAAAAGDGRRVMLVAGEPGMGKTTLCAELVRRVHAQGGVVLYGRCDEELGIPYQPFAECLAHYVAHAPAQPLADHVGVHGGELQALAPGLARRLPDLPGPRSADPDTQRHMLFAATVGLVEEVSGADPLLVVLDDLHWADQATLALLRYLVSASARLRLMLVGTYRPSELSRDRPLAQALVALRKEAGVDRLDLSGLGDDDVIALLERGTDQELGQAGVALAQALRRETDGNPFFVLELLRHLVEGGSVYQQDGRWLTGKAVADLGMPESVREVVSQRVARLGADTEQLLDYAAVIGREIDVEVLAALTGRPDDELIDLLDRASAAALLTDIAPGRYGFAHAVIQHTLHDAQGPSRRALAHRRVAETLERLYGAGPGPRVAELARHWVAAPPSDVATALRYASWAAEAAMAGLAFEEAVRWFTQALDLESRQPSRAQHRRAELLIGLGSAQRMAGDAAFRETLLEAARLAEGLGDTERLVRAALRNSRGTFSSWGAVDTERVAALEAALAAAQGDSPERARLLATLAVELTFAGDWAHRRDVAADALAMARRLGDPEATVRVLNLTYFCVCVPETLEQRVADFREAVSRPDALADPAVRHWAYRHLLYSCADGGDVTDVDSHLEAVDEAATASGDPFLLWAAAFIRFWRTLLDGRLEEAEALADEAHRIGTDSGYWEAGFIYLMELFDLRRQQGRVGELEEPLAAAATATGIPFLRALLANVYLDAGKQAEARQQVAVDADDDFAAFQYEFSWLYGLVHHAEACARLGLVDVASTLYERLRPWHDQVAFFYWSTGGSVAFYLGMLATTLSRYDEAEAHFAEAADIHGGLRSPFWVARNRLEWASMLSARGAPGDADRARAFLDELGATAARHGFAGLQQRSEAH